MSKISSSDWLTTRDRCEQGPRDASLDRWLSGRKHTFAKGAYLTRVPRVRIPPGPPLLAQAIISPAGHRLFAPLLFGSIRVYFSATRDPIGPVVIFPNSY